MLKLRKIYHKMLDNISYYDIIRASRKEVVSVVENEKELLEITAKVLEIIAWTLTIETLLRNRFKEPQKNRKRVRRKKRKR